MPKKKTSTSQFTDTAHNVWLAGLGALASAGEEGEKLFKTLVSRGARVEKTMVRPVDRAGSRLRRTVGSLQSTIDDGVESALHRIGVPTRKEIAALSRRVEKLSRAVDGNGAGRAKPKRKVAKKATAKKATAKRRTAKRATA